MDLGPTGEDNFYGRGMIDLEAAFNYLVNEGFVPVDPIVNNDVIAVDMNVEGIRCNGSFDATVEFENAGLNNLTALDILYELKVIALIVTMIKNKIYEENNKYFSFNYVLIIKKEMRYHQKN